MIKRLFGPVSIGTRNQHGSIFFDFNNGSGCFLDLSNGLTTRSDQQTDFIRLDFGFDQARSIFGNILTGPRYGFQHRSKNLHSSIFRLYQCCADDVLGDSRDFQIQLDSRNSVLGSRDLKVHITKMVLVTKDVGEQCPLVFGFTNQSN